VLIDAHNVNRSVLVELANEVPNAKIVVMNPDWEGLDVLDCIRIADAGFALMGDPSDRIINIVQSVLEGKPIVPPVIFERIQQQIRRDSRLKSVNGSLTVREQHIFELLLDGSSNQEIANKLNVSLATVKNHVHAILLKLDCRSRHEVFRRFAGSGGALNRRSEWNPGN
jgi:DNA-binding NarL/FixJ family response regulator